MSIKDTARTIICFGDSNTWGSVPHQTGIHSRFPRSIRWPGRLQDLLGEDYFVVGEGLSGRTLVAENPEKPERTGITHLTSILKTGEPVYLIVVMLGTNDTKDIYNLTAQDIAKHLEQVISLVRKEDSKIKILVLCPAKPILPKSGDIDPRMKRAPEMFEKLPALYKEVADKTGCTYINANDYVSSSLVDGYHLDSEAHKKLAEVVAEKVKAI